MSKSKQTDGLQIRRATVRNFSRINWVEVHPKQNAVFVIGGKNAQGKSSLMNAIIAGIGGKALMPEKPVRAGTERADTMIELGSQDTTEYTIRQYVTAKGTYGLEVRSKDGFVHPQGQSFLASFYEKLSFDPLAFVNQTPKGQIDLMNKALGLDFSGLDYERRQLFDTRTLSNREVNSLEAQLRAIKTYPDLPAEPVSVSSLSAQLEQVSERAQGARAISSEIHTKRELMNQATMQIERCNSQAEDFRKRVVDLLAEAEAASEKLSGYKASIAALESQASEDKDFEAEAVDIRRAISEADATNRKIASNKEAKQIQKKLNAAKQNSERLSAELGKIDSEKERTLQKAKFPVKGIQMGEDGVTLNGIPFSQASASEKLRVSLNIAFALKPELKVVFADGSSLDDEGLEIIEKEAKAASVQVLLELPLRTKEDEAFTSIIIEDGYVRGADDEPTPENFLTDQAEEE